MRRCLPVLIAWSTAASVALGQEDESPPSRQVDRDIVIHSETSLSATLGLQGLDLTYTDNDTELRVHGGGVAALDLRLYDDRNTRDSELDFDRAVFRLDGWLDDHWSARLGIDVINIDTRNYVAEGWLAYEESSALRLSAGMLRIPLGMENSIPEEDMSFVGYGFAAYLTGRSDLAVRAEGEFDEGFLYYDLTAAAGEGYDLNGQKRGDPQYSARLVTFPLRSCDSSFEFLGHDIPMFSGAYFSAAVAHTTDYDAELDVNNPLRNKLFNTGRLDADASRFVHFSFGADWGPFLLAGEKVVGSYRNLKTPVGERSLRNQTTSWQASFSWMITGEHYDSRPMPVSDRRPQFPAHPFNCDDGEPGCGAFEVAIRYANGDIDRDFFEFGITNFNISSQEFRAFTAAINWYATQNIRATAEVVRTIADQYPATFESHGRDTSYVLRLQYKF